jgi:hypothetical protein
VANVAEGFQPDPTHPGTQVNVGGAGTGGGDKAPETGPPQPQPQAQVAASVEELRGLPSHLAAQVQSGAMNIAEAVAIAERNAGKRAGTTPIPQLSKPVIGLNQPVPEKAVQVLNAPPVLESPGNRLQAGAVLSSGRTGLESFSRPGGSGRKAFMGQAFGPGLRRPDAVGGRALSARAALATGEAGRQPLANGTTAANVLGLELEDKKRGRGA